MVPQVMAIKRKQYLACLEGILGGIFVGIGLSQGGGGLVLTLFGTSLLWASNDFPLASFLWGGAATLLSHSWLLALHPLTWLGVPEVLSLPIALF